MEPVRADRWVAMCVFDAAGGAQASLNHVQAVEAQQDLQAQQEAHARVARDLDTQRTTAADAQAKVGP